MTLPRAEVVGKPIAQSKSPVIHGFWLDKLGLPGRYDRTLVEVADLPAFLAGRRVEADWRGCNVTVPHKQAVLPLLDRLDPLAARIGAANVVLREGHALVGYNTDAPGFLEPLRPWLGARHLRRVARVMGTGGAARAIAHALAGKGFTMVVLGRDTAKAEALAAELPGEHHAGPLAAMAAPLDFDWGDTGQRLDLVVNATTLGMQGQPPLPLHPSTLPPHAIVYDAVYAPLETPLLAVARAAGHPVIDGLAMLVGQAADAFRLFFGAEPPRQHDAELRALLTA